jgi:hypothetical protein
MLLASPALQRIAIARSRALLNVDLNLSVIWSAKSACTTVYTWFACVSGFGHELTGEGQGPHIHRINVYEKSDLCRRSLKAGATGFRTLRVIRDPYSRAVSSYRHALMNAYSQPYMTASSKGRLNRQQGYSFQQFLDMLETVDIRRSNPHFRAQFRPMERFRAPDAVINISKSDLFAELERVEDMWSLPRSDLRNLGWFVAREENRKADNIELQGANLDQEPFNAAAARGQATFPSYRQLLTPLARSRIAKIYEIDCSAYAAYL